MNSQLEIKLAPTPESDKAKIAFTSLFANDDAYWIPYAIGKKLERERDDARESHRLSSVCRSMKIERDEARQTLCMIARLSVDLSDSPKSLQSHMTAWAKLYLENDDVELPPPGGSASSKTVPAVSSHTLFSPLL